MNDYLTFKMIDSDRADAARRQRNADHLAELEQPAAGRKRLLSRIRITLPAWAHAAERPAPEPVTGPAHCCVPSN